MRGSFFFFLSVLFLNCNTDLRLKIWAFLRHIPVGMVLSSELDLVASIHVAFLFPFLGFPLRFLPGWPVSYEDSLCRFCPVSSNPCWSPWKWNWTSLSSVQLFVTSLWPLCDHGLYSPWNSPGQNPGVGSLSLPGDLPNSGIESRFP